jgi:hypothetical protein
MPKNASPASANRARLLDQALTEARRGQDANRNLADRQLEPSHGDPPRGEGLPNTSRGLKR